MPQPNFPELAFPRLWQALAALATMSVVTLSLIPSPPQPPGPLAWDTAQHALAYSILAVAWLQSTRAKRWELTLAGVLFLGVVIELLQGMTEARQLQIADMLANTLGVAVGSGLCLTPFAGALGLIDRSIARWLGHKAQAPRQNG
jgi:VanZ family protein